MVDLYAAVLQRVVSNVNTVSPSVAALIAEHADNEKTMLAALAALLICFVCICRCICTCCCGSSDGRKYAQLKDGKGKKARTTKVAPSPGGNGTSKPSPGGIGSSKNLLKSPDEMLKIEMKQAEARRAAIEAAESKHLSKGMTAAMTAEAARLEAIEADRLAAAKRIREYNKMMKDYEAQANDYDPNRPMHAQVKDSLPTFGKGSGGEGIGDSSSGCNVYPHASTLPGVGVLSGRELAKSTAKSTTKLSKK